MRVSAKLSQLPNDYMVLNDLIFRTEKVTTQIDHVVVSKYGVFAIETKNYRGEIYGDDNRQEWTQLIVTEVTYAKKWWKTYTYVTKNHFYNPVKQSVGHALRIKEMLSAFPHVKIVPIVVFAGDSVLVTPCQERGCTDAYRRHSLSPSRYMNPCCLLPLRLRSPRSSQ